MAALSSSSAFWAAVFLLPKTIFKLVLLAVVVGATDNLGPVKALEKLTALRRMKKERIAAMIDFMLNYFCLKGKIVTVSMLCFKELSIMKLTAAGSRLSVLCLASYYL